ncbi:P-loop containing nucleoside triphosphate hydrolases superfamily protein [Raphanus sativus]|uniref:AAA-ATPase At3g28570, mitochondrial n=1 Tax=Raphanus sativus TaxID=3726 RepID=A0A6J0NKT4_RAPSA|nr:AAA-ATPase At3g28570, mitochondrial [Raphanus sativus]KAJ4900936.1 P-loop containing nucleoside triphosphate hydrolases superfamily protein [Raphanus sativus]
MSQTGVIKDQKLLLLQKKKSKRNLIEILMGSIVKPLLGDNLTTIGSNIAGLLFIIETLRRYFPGQLKVTIQQLLVNAIHRLPFFKKCADKTLAYFSPYAQIRFREIEEYRYNYAYSAIKTYLGAQVNPQVKNLKGSQMRGRESLDFKRDDDKVEDEYEGAKMWWEDLKSTDGVKMCRLTFHRSNWEVVTGAYLSYVVEEGKSIEEKKKTVRIFMNNPSSNWKLQMKHLWSSIDFEHPATFDTMAMDPKKKDEIMSDLLEFREGEEYYKKIGKAWKRGYLLHGPPGTGKSTMIAAMANLMSYSIYDLELTSIENNWELKKLLLATSSKSIIVIEDIDCSLDLTGERGVKEDHQSNAEIKREKKKENSVTLSGLLNFIDGIWSAYGQKRILVFTTNHLGKLDQALIRRGRMDMHIELSYCRFEAFKILAKNYLNLDSHPLFGEIETLLEETNMTPADVAENLMVKYGESGVDGSLKGLVRALEQMKLNQHSNEQQKEIEYLTKQ